MATSTLAFSDGGTLSAEYDGYLESDVTLTASSNEGKDRSLTLTGTTTDGNATASAAITQNGRREEFVAGENFYASDGEFLVIKNGLQ